MPVRDATISITLFVPSANGLISVAPRGPAFRFQSLI